MFDEIPGADRYDVEEEVGHGTFSEVHRARDRQGGGLVALKHMYMREEGVLPRHVHRELRVLRAVHHPAVVALLDVQQAAYSVVLVLEYCLADLRTVMARLRGTPLDTAVAKAVAQQLLQALAALHAAGFVHRDVAPTNLLVAPSGAVKLADFGQTRLLPGTAGSAAANGAVANGTAAANGVGVPAAADDDSDSDSTAGDAAGSDGCLTPGAALCTRWYKAPELLFNSRGYGQAVDVWGAGCIIAELLSGKPLFPGSSDIAQLALMSDLLGSISEERWPDVRELPDWGKLIFEEQAAKDLAETVPGAPPAAVALLAGLLQYDPNQRLTAAAALSSPWFSEEPLPAAPQVLAGIVRQVLS